MRVAINAQLLSERSSYRGAGVSNYSKHLLQALGTLTDESTLDLTAYVNAPHFAVNGIEMVRSRLPLHQPLARIAWEQSYFPLALNAQRADLVHGLVNVLPLATHVPGIVTVHDLSFVRVQEKLPAAKRWYLTQLCRASVRKAAHIIAVSRQTADDLMHEFQVPAAKVSVIYNGVSDEFRSQSEMAVVQLRQKYGLPARFLLYLGTLEPRKNLSLLIRAYARWQAEQSFHGKFNDDVHLVLAGGKGWFYEEIFQLVQALGLAEWIHFPGFIPTDELPTWYSAAEAFIYPSLFEGFGLPVLEAMACGVPVICSDIPVLQEVAGEGALTFVRTDEDALAHTIDQLLRDQSLRENLVKAGCAQAQKFSWRACAEATLALYHQW